MIFAEGSGNPTPCIQTITQLLRYTAQFCGLFPFWKSDCFVAISAYCHPTQIPASQTAQDTDDQGEPPIPA
jgi:hypothetical protein